MAPGTERWRHTTAPQLQHQDSRWSPECLYTVEPSISLQTCQAKAGSIFYIFSVHMLTLSVDMEMPAKNKHPLIDTIVYTGSIFCKVTEP